MQLIKKHSQTIITAAVWLLLFLSLYVRNGLLLASLEKSNLVWYASGCFANTGNIIVSAFKYLHCFITQFAYYPLLGVFVILLLCFVFCGLYKALFKGQPFSHYWALLFIVGWQITFPYLGLHLLFVGIIITALALLVKIIKNKVARYVLIGLLSVAAFFIVKDIVQTEERALRYWALPQPLCFFPVIGIRKIICVTGALLMLMPFVSGIAYFASKKTRFFASMAGIMYLLVLFLTGASTVLYIDRSPKTILETEKILNNNLDGKVSSAQWTEAYSTISNFYDKYAEICVTGVKEKEILSGHATVAFLMSGQRVDQFFGFFGKAFEDALMLNIMHTYSYPFLVMYYNLGFYAEVLHIGNDELVTLNNSCYVWNLIINTCFETAEYESAKKLIGRLDKTIFYKKKAVKYKKLPQNNVSPIEKENKNFRVDAYSPDTDILQRAKRSAENDANYAFFQRYVLLHELLTKNVRPGDIIVADNQTTYIRFTRAYSGFLAGIVTKEELKAEFGKTYFYYYYFASQQ
jgi:hypothetical protein